jgi:hypothetical protein
MNAILWIFIALAFGFLMLTNLQEKLPDELSYLKGGPTVAASGVIPEGWTKATQGDAVELTYTMPSTQPSQQGAILGVLCNKGQLDVRVDPQFATTGITSTPLIMTGRGEEQWDKGADATKTKTFNIYPPQPLYFLKNALATRSTTLQLSSASNGIHDYVLDGAALSVAIRALSEECQSKLR